MMSDKRKVFEPPPEAPVFEPTSEEFQNPIAFINSIKHIVEKVGICKIRPPPEWQPPFAVDVDSFKFVPRMQKINELEATTRVKLNFLDKLLKFWELQGTAIKIPTVDRKLLDFHKLHKTVQSEGGYDTVVRERKWTKVAVKMDLHDPTVAKCNGSVLRSHYEKFLYPYDLFEAGITVDQNILKEELRREESAASPTPLQSSSDTTTNSSGPRARKRKDDKFVKTYGSKSPKKESGKTPDIDYSANSELKKLQFFGAGPKAAVPLQLTKANAQEEVAPVKEEAEPESAEQEPELVTSDKEKKERKWKMRDRAGNWRASYLEELLCVQCEKSNNEQQILVCDGCCDAYHMYCLVPPLIDMPKGDWRCPKCVAKECAKPKAVYGFEQSKREFSLQEFGEMADQFKSDYFQMPVHKVPCDVVEREFWRLTTCLDEDITVQYGADIHALTMGSGFPTKKNADLLPGDEKYVTSPWNINNLPVNEKSVLKYVTGDVSGMKVPWNYVGMCFSCFCWHIEDHWSYSVNYHHWGEPKTWYGVPSSHGQQLEDVMKSRAPELFEQSPDLLHHITTIMDPNTLQSHGIPVVRTNQCAGEFIVTFPRAYHAGFNQGYNFCEAVNFCPCDWLPFGRECISHYKLVKRNCVFSHEELVCKMAADPDSMDLQLAAFTHKEMCAIVEFERQHRRAILEQGLSQAEQEPFELLPDDERQCSHCKTTCFMSAVTCPCKPNELVCIEHYAELCECAHSNKVLRYRYTLEELPHMIHQLRVRAEMYDSWSTRAKSALTAAAGEKLSLPDMRGLVQEAREKKYPDTGLTKNLQRAITDSERCANLASALVNKNLRQPLKPIEAPPGDKRTRLSVHELELFLNTMHLLPCIVKETQLIESFLQKVTDFQTEAQSCLTDEIPPTDRLQKLYQFGCTLDLDIVETAKLKAVLAQSQWLDEVRQTLERASTLTLQDIKLLMDEANKLAPHPAVEKALAELHELISIGERWEEKAKICLQARPRHIISTIEAIISEAKGIPAQLPNVIALKEALKKAKDWISSVEGIQMAEHYPYLDILEELVNKGRPIPVRLELLPQVESQVTAAKSWRERTARTFLKKNSTYTLLEVLSPRSDVGQYPVTKKRKKKDGGDNLPSPLSAEKPDTTKQYRDPAQMVESFKHSELTEVESMRALRAKNMEKHRQEDSGEIKYCLCRKGPSGFMFQCELCKDWFHGHCVPICKPSLVKNKSAQSAWLQAARENKFLCPFCHRSRRPRLETILSLLVSLQKLPVRLTEGEALQCLTERAMAWQDRARQALATDELASALAKLSVLSQRIVEQAAREKTEKIINAELQKAAGNPELQGHFTSALIPQSVASISNQLGPVKAEPGEQEGIPESVVESAEPGTGQPSSVDKALLNKKQSVIEVKSSADISEHAYSTVSKTSNPKATGSNTPSLQSTESPRKHARKSPLVPRSMNTGPLLELSNMARAQLEELMMEGDLLEVALDETQHIWKILQACSNSGNDDRILEFEEQEIDFQKPKVYNKQKEKKRKIKPEVPATASIVIPGIPGQQIVSLKRPKKEPHKYKTQKSKEIVKPIVTSPADTNKKPTQPPQKQTNKRRHKKKKSPSSSVSSPAPGQQQPGAVTKTVSVDKLTGEVEEDEDCSARKCLKPSGEEVDWVQCDKCEEWFHLICLGLDKKDLDEEDDFVCPPCALKQAHNLAAGDHEQGMTASVVVAKVTPTTVESEEIISVVSTPVPSASQSPVNDISSAGDGPKIKLTSVTHDDMEDLEITSTVVRPGDSNMEVDIEGDDKLITTTSAGVSDEGEEEVITTE